MTFGRVAQLVRRAGFLLSTLLVCASAWAVEPALPSSVDVYWRSTRTLVVPGVTNVVILDDEIANAQLGSDTIEFAGLSRGSTVALAFVNGSPVSIVINVIEHLPRVIPPSLLLRESELAHGVYGSDFQTSNAGGTSSVVLVNNFAWSQQMGDTHVDVNSQVEDNTDFGGRTVNFRTGGVSYRTPHMAVNVVDFSQSLTGMSAEDHINNFSSPSIMELRGAGVTLAKDRNQYSFFAGSTIPYYFLSLNATRDVAGFTFHRKQTQKLNFFAGISYANIPLALDSGILRHSYVMQTAGASYKLSKNLLIGAQGGFSNAGGLLRFDASYASFRFSGYGSAILASQTFPLEQLQSLFSGTSSLRGGASYRTTMRLTQGFYFEHSTITPGLVYRFSGSTDYLSPTFGYHISRGETMNFSYTYSRSLGGFSPAATTGSRYDVSVNSQLTPRINNTSQVTVGSLQDPLQINSEDQFSIRDAISVPIKGQTLMFGVEHDRTQPSLISKLNGELNLLSPTLQAEFLANPAAFIDSTNFPPEIKALLAAEQPAGTTFSASGNIALGTKLRLSPNFSLTRAENGNFADNWTQSFGYSLSYQLRPTLQFRSSLNNLFFWNSRQNATQKTMVLSAGFQKTFSAVPGSLPLLHRSRIIQGRVFRDNNINGAFNAGEPGLVGIEVRLDDGQTAITDEQGRYRFSAVSAEQHQVSIDITQFRGPVRMTTRSEIPVDLIQQHVGIADFGILDFARVMGNVYNDLRFDNHRQPDSKGMQGIELLLDNSKNARRIETTGSGDFELDNIPPGDYKLSIDSASLPANYLAPVDSVAIHVSPVTTVVQDIPMRALRSISGRVLLRMPSSPEQTAQQLGAVQNARKTNAALSANGHQEKQKNVALPQTTDGGFVFIPLADVQIRANEAVVKTDQDGNFLIRNLPAGKVAISLLPVKPLAEGLKLPSGEVNLPADPIQVQGASILISNPELVPYLTAQPLPNGPGVAPGKSAPLLQGRVLPGTPVKSSRKTSLLTEQPGPKQGSIPPPAAEPTKAVASLPSSSPAGVATHAIAISELPSSTAGSRLAQVSAAAPAAPMIARTTPSAGVAKPIDCSNLPSLGETARCFRQLHNR